MCPESVHGRLSADASAGYRRIRDGQSTMRRIQSASMDARASRGLHGLRAPRSGGSIRVPQRLASKLCEGICGRECSVGKTEQGGTGCKDRVGIPSGAPALPEHGTCETRCPSHRTLFSDQPAEDGRSRFGSSDDHPFRQPLGATVRLATDQWPLASRADQAFRRRRVIYPVTSGIRESNKKGTVPSRTMPLSFW